MAYRINDGKCMGCGMCEENCPVHAIDYLGNEIFRIREEDCIACGLCERHCFPGAIYIVPENQVNCN